MSAPLRSSAQALAIVVDGRRGSWSAYPASFLVGVAAYWWWWYALAGVPRWAHFLPAAWFAMGFVAGLGAGRAALLLGRRIPDGHLSLAGQALGYMGGCGMAMALPEAWLEIVDLAGLVFIMLLAMGWLVGIGEIAMAGTSTRRR